MFVSSRILHFRSWVLKCQCYDALYLKRTQFSPYKSSFSSENGLNGTQFKISGDLLERILKHHQKIDLNFAVLFGKKWFLEYMTFQKNITLKVMLLGKSTEYSLDYYCTAKK